MPNCDKCGGFETPMDLAIGRHDCVSAPALSKSVDVSSQVKEGVASVKRLVADIERHLAAGAIVKANSRASDLEHSARELNDATHKLAFPKEITAGKECWKCHGVKVHLDTCSVVCLHRYGKTEVQGGGESCNHCGDFC